MKIDIFLSFRGYKGRLIQDQDTNVFKKYKTYNPDKYVDTAYSYYYFILNNIVYLKII